MAILHRAYRFHGPAFVGSVASLAPRGGSIDHDRLRERARHVIARQTIDTDVLEDLRFNREWLAPPDNRSDRLRESLAILLAEHLHRVPGLGDRHLAVTRKLEEEGWTAKEISLLLTGRTLAPLLTRTEVPGIVETFAGVDVFGGWIPETDVLRLAARIARVDDFDDVAAMLADAVSHQSALFVILD